MCRRLFQQANNLFVNALIQNQRENGLQVELQGHAWNLLLTFLNSTRRPVPKKARVILSPSSGSGNNKVDHHRSSKWPAMGSTGTVLGVTARGLRVPAGRPGLGPPPASRHRDRPDGLIPVVLPRWAPGRCGLPRSIAKFWSILTNAMTSSRARPRNFSRTQFCMQCNALGQALNI